MLRCVRYAHASRNDGRGRDSCVLDCHENPADFLAMTKCGGFAFDSWIVLRLAIARTRNDDNSTRIANISVIARK